MSKLNFKDPADSALVNSKYVGRLGDDETIGKLDLANIETESGDSIVNLQRQVNENKNKLLPNQALTASGEMLTDSISKTQIVRVSGDSAAITTALLPFGASPDIQDGTILYVIGQDDINTVTISHNDNQDGTLLNGNATLLKGYCLQLFWDATQERFIDIGRNF